MTAREHWSTTGATLVGTLTGVSVLIVYTVGGLFFAGWSVSSFGSHLTLEIALSVTVAGIVAVADIAIPLFVYLRYRIVSPLVVLVAVSGGWLALAVFQDLLTLQTVFALGAYAFYVSPVYLGLYLVTGGLEYSLRQRGAASDPR